MASLNGSGLPDLKILKKKAKPKDEKAKVPTDVVGPARPTNAEAERVKFFSGEEENYEPQFVYKLPPPVLLQALRRYSAAVQVETRYFPTHCASLERCCSSTAATKGIRSK